MPERFVLSQHGPALVRKLDASPTLFEKDEHAIPTTLIAMDDMGFMAILSQPRQEINEQKRSTSPTTYRRSNKRALIPAPSQELALPEKEPLQYLLVTSDTEWEPRVLRDEREVESVIYHHNLLPVLESDEMETPTPLRYESYAEALADVKDYAQAKFEEQMAGFSLPEDTRSFMRSFTFDNLALIKQKEPETYPGQLALNLLSGLAVEQDMLDGFLPLLDDLVHGTSQQQDAFARAFLGRNRETVTLTPTTAAFAIMFDRIKANQQPLGTWPQELGKTLVQHMLEQTDYENAEKVRKLYAQFAEAVDFSGFSLLFINGVQEAIQEYLATN